ncbi:hypothetical protein NC652_002747 [Populus alba x Populus x berolinensis]|nr:hypothetical protein NC652_002747 [Populus alba x Populus x berolinensis]
MDRPGCSLVPMWQRQPTFHFFVVEDCLLGSFIVGNASIDDETDNQGMYDFFGTHALISYENLRKIRRYCDFSRDHESAECHHHSLLKTDAGVWNAIDLMNFDPCSDYYVYAYLNRPDVQEAMHANVTKLTYDWEPCGDF